MAEILIIDDDRNLRETLRDLLEGAGYRKDTGPMQGSVCIGHNLEERSMRGPEDDSKHAGSHEAHASIILNPRRSSGRGHSDCHGRHAIRCCRSR